MLFATMSSEPPRGRRLASLSLAALGVVFGDIGTSPLYAFRECFREEHGLPLTAANIHGVLSLIFWSLTIVISVKYLSYVLRADNHGEGGILALMALASRVTKGKLAGSVVVALGLFGAALLYGDGMITPAISVLSAVEGLHIAAPALSSHVLLITIAILIGLFMLQRRGTAGIGALFGPVTLIWFFVIGALGLAAILDNPSVLLALDPRAGIALLTSGKLAGFLVLGSVFLVVTGGEALYADMGHFGPRPIRLTWFVLVLPALLLNYFGQGALLLANPGAIKNPFYRLAPDWALYPLVGLATLATIIASQAVISGAFSLTRQATMLGFWPRVEIQHKSEEQIGQIYVPGINWLLMVVTVALVLAFGSSSSLASAYGIAVTTTMVITTALAFVVARRRWSWPLWAAGGLSLLFLVLDLGFFAANLVKVENGGWFPLAVAGLGFLLMSTWKKGRALLGERVREELVPLDELFERISESDVARVEGTAVYMTSNLEVAPAALTRVLEHNHALHEKVILLTVTLEDEARVTEDRRIEVKELREGFTRVVAHYGFMENPDIPKLLEREDTPTPELEETSFVLGYETLLPTGHRGMQRWRQRVFAAMSRNSQPATAFFNIPAKRVLEVGSQIEL
ncbi:MAG: potassium transporter Kup [Myxococcales bacterium]|nr:potassium transporter Kup [Myxococcales bacterium]